MQPALSTEMPVFNDIMFVNSASKPLTFAGILEFSGILYWNLPWRMKPLVMLSMAAILGGIIGGALVGFILWGCLGSFVAGMAWNSAAGAHSQLFASAVGNIGGVLGGIYWGLEGGCYALKLVMRFWGETPLPMELSQEQFRGLVRWPEAKKEEQTALVSGHLNPNRPHVRGMCNPPDVHYTGFDGSDTPRPGMVAIKCGDYYLTMEKSHIHGGHTPDYSWTVTRTGGGKYVLQYDGTPIRYCNGGFQLWPSTSSPSCVATFAIVSDMLYLSCDLHQGYLVGDITLKFDKLGTAKAKVVFRFD